MNNVIINKIIEIHYLFNIKCSHQSSKRHFFLFRFDDKILMLFIIDIEESNLSNDMLKVIIYKLYKIQLIVLIILLIINVDL